MCSQKRTVVKLTQSPKQANPNRSSLVKHWVSKEKWGMSDSDSDILTPQSAIPLSLSFWRSQPPLTKSQPFIFSLLILHFLHLSLPFLFCSCYIIFFWNIKHLLFRIMGTSPSYNLSMNSLKCPLNPHKLHGGHIIYTPYPLILPWKIFLKQIINSILLWIIIDR